MITPDPPASPGAEALANRRWLIGIGITVLFGLFGVVMALLAYWDRTPAPEPPAAGAPPGAAAQPATVDTPAPANRGPGKDRDKKRDPE